MQFTDPWLLSDTDVLDDNCTVLIPPPSSAVEDLYGLGGISTQHAGLEQELACLEIPARQIIVHEQGCLVKIPRQLIIRDPTQQVQASRELRFHGKVYRIETVVESTQHELCRVTLQHTR